MMKGFLSMKKRIISLVCALLVLGGVFIVYATGQTGTAAPTLHSETAVLIDGDTGQVLFDKDMHRKMNPASITKVMTALLALEEGDLADIITMSYDAVFSIGKGTSNIALDTDEQITLEQALYAVAIVSANDAANGIAEAIGGTMDAFTQKMNQRAAELGAQNTTFTNAHGLTEDNHLTTAYDMARITMEAIKHPEFCQIFNTLTYSIPPTNKQSETRNMSNKNGLMSGEYQYEGLVMSKTGITTAAGNTLVSVARRDGRTLIAVVLRTVNDSTLKYQDTTALFDYGFSAFTPVTYTAQELSRPVYLLQETGGGQTEVSLTAPDTTVLLLNSLTPNDMTVDYAVDAEGATATLTLKDTFKDRMSLPLAVIPLTVTYPGDAEAPVAGTPDDVPEKEGRSIGKVFLTVLGVLLGLFILAFLGLFIMRQVNLNRRRKRRRRRSGR